MQLKNDQVLYYNPSDHIPSTATFLCTQDGRFGEVWLQTDNPISEALIKTNLCEELNHLTEHSDEFTEPVFEFSVPAGQGAGAVSFPRQL